MLWLVEAVQETNLQVANCLELCRAVAAVAVYLSTHAKAVPAGLEPLVPKLLEDLEDLHSLVRRFSQPFFLRRLWFAAEDCVLFEVLTLQLLDTVLGLHVGEGDVSAARKALLEIRARVSIHKAYQESDKFMKRLKEEMVQAGVKDDVLVDDEKYMDFFVDFPTWRGNNPVARRETGLRNLEADFFWTKYMGANRESVDVEEFLDKLQEHLAGFTALGDIKPYAAAAEMLNDDKIRGRFARILDLNGNQRVTLAEADKALQPATVSLLSC